jgi:signal transduction histidine kinase
MDMGAFVASRAPTPRDWRPLVVAGSVSAAVAVVTASAAIAADGAPSHGAQIAAARALIVGVPLAVGLHVWSRRRDERFGLLLVAVGAAWFVTTLAESSHSVAYSVGRTAGWLAEVLLVYVILSFPSGRLRERADRVLFGAMALVVLTLFVPRLVLAGDFDVPSPFTSCVGDCPANAFQVPDAEPGFVDAVMRPAGSLLSLVVLVAVMLRLGQRVRHAPPLTRRMLVPVLAVGSAHAGLVAFGLVARDIDASGAAVELTAWLLALSVPAIALAFLASLLGWQVYAGRVLQRLAVCLREMPDAPTLRRAFAHAFADPTIEIAFPVSGARDRWMDPWGRPVAVPADGSGRSVSQVRNGGHVVAAIIHDAALAARRVLIDAGAAMAGIVLDNQRLAAEAEAAMREVRQSRARIAAGAERERRRIERDLHDGAQQRLVALRIELELAEDVARREPQLLVGRLQELEREVDETLEDIRSLAHGVYPPLLADRGLTEALQAVARRSAIAVDLDAHDVGRYPPEVESAVYFCVLEALQNVLKHAEGARHVVVSLDGGTYGELRFSVRDDGAGAPDGAIHAGAGITNMHDRLAAVGGGVEVTSTPRVGTVVSGCVPTRAQAGV